MSYFTREIEADRLEEELTGYQRAVSILLYVALFAHGFEVFLTNVGVLEGLIPALQVVAAVSALAFFVLESLLLPPVGLALITAVATLLSLAIPYFVAFMVRSFIESFLFMVVGGLIAAATTITVIVVVNGVVAGVILVPLVVTPLFVGMGSVGITAVTGAAVGAAVDAGVRQIRPGQLIRPRRLLINLLALLLVVWPLLSWTGVFQGVFALKPVQRAQQQYLSFSQSNTSRAYQMFFEPDGSEFGYTVNEVRNWTFGEGFYTDYIYPGRNTFAQGKDPAASNDTCIAFCLNDLIYLTDVAANEVYHTTAYSPGRDDAMVLVGREAFLFSRDRIALLGPQGRYLWKDTRWATDFDRLSRTEQYDRLYAILQEQNDGVAASVSVEDVAAVACAQRNGQLVYYDAQTHRAFFVEKGKKGSCTLLRQTAPGVREEVGTFTPKCKSDNLPYTMLNAEVLAYIDGEDIMFMGSDGSTWTRYTNKLHEDEQHPFVSFHVLHDTAGNEYFAYQDSEDVICLELLGQPVMEAKFPADRYDAVYSVGDYIYAIVYDSDSIVNTFTYVNDVKEGEDGIEVWTENWGWDRIHLEPGLWGMEEEPEELPEEEKPFAERYPLPELRTSVGQIGLYKDNVVSPSKYVSYRGPANKFRFRMPPILYEEAEYEYAEDGSQVRVHFYCEDDPSSLTATMRPNDKGLGLADVVRQAEREMTNVKRVRNGPDKEGTAEIYYATGTVADDPGLICSRLIRVDGEHIMELELRIPRPMTNEDKAFKDYYMQAMYLTCGFGPGGEPPVWWKFKGKYGL